jgi:cyclopropane fatty-acyl-phospholipid synthase-like methyltransferase
VRTHATQSDRPWSERAREFVRLWSFLLNPTRARADLFYELVSTENYLTERTLFLNVGWWKDRPATFDDACEALARLAGEQLQLGPDDRVLDVGFGFGDQDMYWMEHFKPRAIVGINITRSQVERARERVAARGMSDRIDFELVSATKMPFEDNSFDKVIALESAFHFHTRAEFFAEAFRVLRPGGRLVTLDLLAQPYDQLPFRGRVISWLGLHFWKTCSENVYTREVYESKLRAVGFDARVESIRDDSLVPFSRFTLAELAKPEVASRINPYVAGMLWLPAEAALDNPHGLLTLDYVLAVADRPCAGGRPSVPDGPCT